MAHQGRPLKRKRTGPPASLPSGMMQPPPPAPGLYPQATYGQGFPQPQPHLPPPPYIHQTAPASHSHGFQPPPYSNPSQTAPALHSHVFQPPPYSNPSAPAVQAMYGQVPPPYGNSPAPGLQAQAIYAQGLQPQQHAQGYPSVTGPSFSVGSLPVPPHPPQLNMAVLPRGPQIQAGQGQAGVQIPGQGQGQGFVSLDVKVPRSQCRLVLGKDRCMINYIQSKSGASIVIHGSTRTETTFRINGQLQSVTTAKQLIDTAIRERKYTIDLGHPGNPPKRVPGHAYKLPDTGTSQPP